MAKENVEEIESIDKNASNESIELSKKGKSSEDDEEDDDGEENSTKRKSKQNRHRKESERDEDSESRGRERGESIAIPIEEDATIDAPDGKISQKQSNSYAAKKTVAQGMMDIALITANANQLRYIIEFNRNSPTYYMTLGLIILSLFLQVGVGLSLIFKGRMDLRGQSKHRNAKRINNYVVVGIFLVTIINVFIASFTVTGGGANGAESNGAKVR